jgi:hypothetical protein
MMAQLPKNSRPIKIQDSRTGKILFFPSLASCSRAININPNFIWLIANKKIKGLKGYSLPNSGYVWKKQGQHFKKKFSIKNWRTGEVTEYDSLTECSKELNVPLQTVSEINCGRRVFYGDYCMPQTDYQPTIIAVKNLKDGEVSEFDSITEAARTLGISLDKVKQICSAPSFRWKNFASTNFSEKLVPYILDKKTGTKTPFFCRLMKNPKSKNQYYRLFQKRLAADERYLAVGGTATKQYKYKIRNTETGEEYYAFSLQDFCKKHGFPMDALYRRSVKNPTPFEVVEG